MAMMFTSIGDLIKLLPTGTVFAYQFLNPVLTNSGRCSLTNKVVTGVLLVLCSLSCCFSAFTDSYVDADGKVHYGIVTTNGMWLLAGENPTETRDLSIYKRRPADYVHAGVSLLVFAVIALLDSDTMSCYYPSFASHQQKALMVLPTVVGGFASWVFGMLPCKRYGIGYRPSAAANLATIADMS